jgi:hypothetical protein
MDYKIIAANAEIGQIQVTYSDSGADIATYAIDVPVVDGVFLTGDALAAEIQSRAPVWLIERKSMVAAAARFDEIQALVQTPPLVAITETPTSLGNETRSIDIVPNIQVL